MGFIIMEMNHMMMVMALDSRGDLLRIAIWPLKTQENITLKRDLLMLDMVDMVMVMG